MSNLSPLAGSGVSSNPDVTRLEQEEIVETLQRAVTAAFNDWHPAFRDSTALLVLTHLARLTLEQPQLIIADGDRLVALRMMTSMCALKTSDWSEYQAKDLKMLAAQVCTGDDDDNGLQQARETVALQRGSKPITSIDGGDLVLDDIRHLASQVQIHYPLAETLARAEPRTWHHCAIDDIAELHDALEHTYIGYRMGLAKVGCHSVEHYTDIIQQFLTANRLQAVAHDLSSGIAEP